MLIFLCGYKIQIQIFNCQISPGLTQPVNRVASTTGGLLIIEDLIHFFWDAGWERWQLASNALLVRLFVNDSSAGQNVL